MSKRSKDMTESIKRWPTKFRPLFYIAISVTILSAVAILVLGYMAILTGNGTLSGLAAFTVIPLVASGIFASFMRMLWLDDAEEFNNQVKEIIYNREADRRMAAKSASGSKPKALSSYMQTGWDGRV